MRDGSDRACRLALWGAITLLLAILVLPLVQGKVFIQDDLGNFHLPLRHFYAGCLARGDNFLWSPHYYCGFYLHGEGQIGLLHPAHLLMYRLLPIQVAFDLELVLAYPALLVGMCFFLRRLGFDRASALFGAMVFAFASFNMLHHVHLNALQVVAHLPWLLVSIDVVLQETDRRRVAWAKLAIALLTLSQFLLGHPQFVIYCLMIQAAYVLFVLVQSRRYTRVYALAESMFFGFLAGAIQWLPTWEALGDSERARPGADFLAEGSLHPANLLQLVAPYTFKARVPSFELEIGYTTHEYGMYCGALLPVFVIWLWIRRDQLGKWKPLVLGCIGFAVFATLIAFGKYLFGTELFALLMAGIFRFPARHILLIQFATSVLSAVAFWDLLVMVRRRETVAWRALWPMGLVLFAGLVPIALKLYFQQISDSTLGERFVPMALAMTGPGLLLIATSLVIAVARGVRYAPVLVVLFAAADQGYYGLTYVCYDPPVPMSKLLDPEQKDPDLSSGRLAATHLDRKLFALSMQGAKLVDGYVALVPQRQLDYRLEVSEEGPEVQPDEQLLARWRLAGVGWLRRGSTWHRLDRPAPRAWLVTEVRESENPQDDLAGIDVLLTALVLDTIPDLSGGRAGEVRLTIDRPGQIVLQTETDSRQLLIVNESYHRGWQVTVNGGSASVVRVNGDYLGCVVGPGIHEVRFHFSPSSFRYGAWLTLAGLLFLAASFARSLVGRKGREVVPPPPRGGEGI